MDRLLDEARCGQFFLAQPSIARMVIDAIHHNARVLQQYNVHAFAVMPNHVHLPMTALVPLPKLTKSLKGITAKHANGMLRLTGNSFWQEETYDRLVRDQREFETVRSYIDENPVRAGLVIDAAGYRWSSAGWPTRGSSADQGSALL
jgi:REP element-mobilizing transposase RayT